MERLTRARDDHERVMVFGDFDADGLDGLAILVIAFRRFGIDVQPYVPSRLEEGHGLSIAAIDTAVAEGVSIIVTVDCGTSSGPEIAAAAARGVDVIVTDHHRVPPELPPAYAVVNPHRRDSQYPDPRLAGSGVAFKVAQLLLGAVPVDLADLATLGTVADVAPIVGENRAIARLGLERLRVDPRPGIAALLERARIAPAALDLDTIAFALAPRLNAAGRVGEALEAARLLLSETPKEAARHADALETANQTRRDLTTTAVAEARELVAASPDRPASIVRGTWPVGIIGLVAARLAEDRARPAVVGTEIGDAIRASCRSDGSVDLAAALADCADLFTRHGGHAGAAGFELAAARWPEFVERFEEIASAHVPPDPRTVARDRSRHPRARRRLPAVPRSRRAPAVRSGQPRAASRGPRSYRHPRACRRRRSHLAHPEARPRRARWDRLRARRHRRARQGGRPDRRRGADQQPDLRRIRVAAAGDPRRRPERVAPGGCRDPRRTGSRVRRGGLMTRTVRPRSREGARSVRHRPGRLDDRTDRLRGRADPDRGGHDQPLRLQPATPRRQWGERREWWWRHRRPGADAGPLERDRRAGGSAVRRQDRLRQGRQHLGAIGCRGDPAHEWWRRLDAVLLARRQLGLLHP